MSNRALRAATFREAFKKRCCIVPATGWYKWSGEKGTKTKHTFRRQDDGVIWFAGLWDRVSTPDAGEFSSFTILTRPSAGWLGDYHTRAPVMLEADEWGDWLDVSRDPAEIIAAVRPDRF